MVLTIDETRDVPLYLQIRDQVVAAVASGELAGGERLPSVRSLASDLGINLHTVNKAYAVLRDEGYVRMRGRAGAFVADLGSVQAPEARAASEEALARDLRKLAVDYQARGGEAPRFLDLAAGVAAQVWGVAR